MIRERLERARLALFGSPVIEERMGTRRAKQVRQAQEQRLARRRKRTRQIPTRWRTGDRVVPATPHDKRVYRLGEHGYLVVVKQGPTYLLAHDPVNDELHHFSVRQARRLVAYTDQGRHAN